MVANGSADPVPFLGRDADVERVRRTLGRGGQLVTLCGPPGVGKSRLAWEVAARLRVDDGAVALVCDLRGVRDVSGLCARVVAAAGGGAAAASAGDTVASVAALVAERAPRLLVLDDFDELIDVGRAALGQWLAAAPSTSILLTSRRRLQGEVECAIELDPLDVAPAEQLFHECARRARPDWSERATARDVVGLVRHLDCLPLGIRLAAARMDVMSPAALLDVLDVRLDVLDGETATGYASLSAAIRASWNGAGDRERRALARASVFGASFTLDAARAVLDVGDLPDLLDVLSSLRARSLVHASATAPEGDGVRFALYATVRAVAAEQLRASGEEDATLARHAAYFGRIDGDWRVDDLTDILHVAATAAPREAVPAAFAAEPLIRLGGGARGVVALLSRFVEPESAAALDECQRARVLELRGRAFRICGDVDAAEADLQAAAQVWRDAGEPGGVARVLNELGIVDFARGRLDAAASWFERAAEAHRACADPIGEACALDALAGAIYLLGRPIAEAREHLMRGLRLTRRAGARDREAVIRGHLGLFALEEGIFDEARRELGAALQVHRELGDRGAQAAELNNLGLVELEEGKIATACARFEEALALAREVGECRSIGVTLLDLGACREEGDDLDASSAAYAEALAVGRLLGDHGMVATALSYLGRAASRGGDMDAARRSFDRAREVLAEHPSAHASAVYAVCARHVNGDAPVATSVGRDSSAVRSALRILAKDRGDGPAVVVDRATRSFSIGRESAVSLLDRPILWRIVDRLVTQCVDSPSVPVTKNELFAAGWPDERISSRSAMGRLRSAIYALRKLGLGDVLISSREGYILRPSIELEVR